jgi:thioredoxin 1
MAGKNVHNFTPDNFDAEVIKSELPVLIEFTGTYCGPCKALAPIVAKVADEFQGKWKVGQIDVEVAPDIATKCGVRNVPSLVIFRDGQKTRMHQGMMTKDKLVKFISD